MSAESISQKTEPRASSRPRRRKNIRAKEMLAAAREVFSRKGFEAASISEIARQADCVEGTIYTYFDSKRALLDAVLTSYYDELIADIEPRLTVITSTEDRLTFLLARHLQIPLDDPGLSKLILTQVRTLDQYFGSPLHALNKRYSRFLSDTLEEGKRRGELSADMDTSFVRDLIFGGIEHWSGNTLARRRQYDCAKTARQILATILPGLRVSTAMIQTDPMPGISARLARIERLLSADGGR
jgi:TetR/AcrR family transcriptional regulator, fatty acid metabolism regulator protein